MYKRQIKVLGDIETKKIPFREYSLDAERRIIEKYKSGELKKEVEGDLLELEYGIKIE